MAINKTTAPAKAVGISLAPSTFVHGGGLLDDADVEVVDAMFVLWDYEGKVTPAVPALGLTLRHLDGPTGDPIKDDKSETGFEDHDQYYSCGSAEFFVPNEDNTGLRPVGDKTALVNSTNAALLLASMTNCGVPESLFASGNIKDIVGIRMHMNRMEQPKKGSGNKPGFQTADPNKKQEVLVCTKLHSLPGEAPKAATAVASKTGAAKPKPVAQTATQPAPQSQPAASAGTATNASPSNGAAGGGSVGGAFNAEDENHVTAASKILEVLAEATDGQILRKNLAPAVFKKFASGEKGGAAAMKLAFDEGFLRGGEAAEMGWKYDGTTVSIAG